MGHRCHKKHAVIFEIGISWPETRAEMVFYVQTEENLQIPEWTTLAAFQGQTHCFPAGATTTSLNRKQTTTDMIVKFSSKNTIKTWQKCNLSTVSSGSLPSSWYYYKTHFCWSDWLFSYNEWSTLNTIYLLPMLLHILFCIYFSLCILFLC